jgi:hypothetical protein
MFHKIPLLAALVLALAACRRERASPWHMRSLSRYRRTFVRFCRATTCLSGRWSRVFGSLRSHQRAESHLIT